MAATPILRKTDFTGNAFRRTVDLLLSGTYSGNAAGGMAIDFATMKGATQNPNNLPRSQPGRNPNNFGVVNDAPAFQAVLTAGTAPGTGWLLALYQGATEVSNGVSIASAGSVRIFIDEQKL